MMDNTSAINLANNPVKHGRSKHIEVKYHFLRDMVNKERIELSHCKTEEQLADVFTKALTGERFDFLKRRIGVVSLNEV
ncbi:hypothetical protein VIGAN_02281800 [Vigna angularis var. angularis]|uniref:Copia protein n=1 Tax=Vigna angularis var. angularis TaxID=157739 RepID=A0A0S3RGU9_PHAAN|nr:hypothetical protein VIGAN_02281800 [Vigna angularis var. angularis]